MKKTLLISLSLAAILTLSSFNTKAFQEYLSLPQWVTIEALTISGMGTGNTWPSTTPAYSLGCATNGDVVRMPMPKSTVSYSGTTNASGNYTVTFASAYSTPPIVIPTIPNQSNKNEVSVVTSVTTTGFTVNVFTRNAITLLSTEVLLAAVSNVSGRNIDVAVISK